MISARSLLAKTGFVAALAAASVSSHATTITLDTTLLEANSTLTFSQDAVDALSVTNTSLTPLGYATSLGNNSAGLPQFNIPVTSLSVDISLFPLSLTLPSAASAKGSSLQFTNGKNGKSVSFGDLNIDFKTDTISGNFTSATGTQKINVFTFSVLKPLQFNLNGGISLTEQLGNLYMTSDAINAFKTGLGLPGGVTAILPSINFGTIDAKIVPWFRSTPLSSIKAVPEPSSYAIMGLGLGMLTLSLRRKSA